MSPADDPARNPAHALADDPADHLADDPARDPARDPAGSPRPVPSRPQPTPGPGNGRPDTPEVPQRPHPAPARGSGRTGTQSEPVDARIVRIAAEHNRVITRAQLLEAGIGRSSIAHRVARCRLYPVYPGVFLLEPPAMASRLTVLTAAVAASGPAALASHESAAELWGLIDEQPPDAPVAVTAVGRSIGCRRQVRRHRTLALRPIDQRELRGVKLTSVARTIADLATTRPLGEVEQAVAIAVRRRLTTVAQLRAVMRRYPLHRGTRRLTAVLEHRPVMTRSEGERRLLALIRQAGLPTPRVNARVLGFELDFWWPTAMVNVELDGFDFHSDRSSFERDRRRDQTLVAHGYRVLRFTALQLRDEPLVVVARIAQALGQR